MKTKLSPLLTAFDALDLALRVAGVIGGLAAIASHVAAPKPADTDGVQAAAYEAGAAQAGARAMHARPRTLRVHAHHFTPPPPPAIVADDDAG